MADPEPQPHEVLVTIHATAVNRADLLQRRGGYDPPPGGPPYLGLEMAGVVAAVGPRASGFAVGDRVCSILAGGGYAEAVAADPSYLMPLPEALSFTEGGGFPEVFLTAYVNLFMEAGLAAGETVLIHGGASGVGTAAIQLARRAGATVCVTARSEAKLDACRQLGAQVTANHATEDWAEVIGAATGGVDVILDCVGADYLARNLQLLRLRGRLVFIATLGGNVAELRIGDLMRKRQRLIGSVLRSRSADGKGRHQRRLPARLRCRRGRARDPTGHPLGPADRAGGAGPRPGAALREYRQGGAEGPLTADGVRYRERGDPAGAARRDRDPRLRARCAGDLRGEADGRLPGVGGCDGGGGGAPRGGVQHGDQPLGNAVRHHEGAAPRRPLRAGCCR